MAKKRWRKGNQSSIYFLKEAGALQNAEIRGALCFRATQIYKICPKKLLVYVDPFHPLFPRPCGRTDLLKEILKKVFNSITGFSNIRERMLTCQLSLIFFDTNQLWRRKFKQQLVPAKPFLSTSLFQPSRLFVFVSITLFSFIHVCSSTSFVRPLLQLRSQDSQFTLFSF